MFNLIKLLCLALLIISLTSFLGNLVLGSKGGIGGIVIGMAGCWVIYDAAIDRIKETYRFKEADAATFPFLYQVITEIFQKVQLPMPQVYIFDEVQPNILSMGVRMDQYAIGVTSGLLKTLNRRELKMVIAHECAHIIQKDMIATTLVSQFAGVLTECAEGIKASNILTDEKNVKKRQRLGGLSYMVVLFLNFLAAVFIQVMVSRSDDLEADDYAVEHFQDPAALISALEKVQREVERLPLATTDRYPATGSMFLINPLLHSDTMSGLFISQPSTELRIQRLLEAQESV